MQEKSFKYRALLCAFRMLPVKKLMASPTEKTQRIFRLAYKGENIPKLYDDAMEIKRLKIAGSSVLYYKLKQPTERLAIYLVGGGMLKYPQPGKIYAGSPGTLLLTDAERMLAYKQEETDVVMSVKAIYTVWDGMTGGKDVPAYMKYLQLGDYTGVRDVYMSFGGDEVFLAGAESIKNRLEEFGVHVTLEIGEGMYHSYAMTPFVVDAAVGHRHYIEYMKQPYGA